MWILDIIDQNAFEKDYDFHDKHTLHFNEIHEAFKFIKEFKKHCPYYVIYKLYERNEVIGWQEHQRQE